jgi:hypothetical protein
MAEEQASVWGKLWVIFQKCFRGLIAEQKDDGSWELSKGNVAFWILLGHCMSVWSKFDPTGVAKLDVSSGEMTILLAVLGYSGLKVGSDMIKTTAATWKGAPKDGG